MTKGCAGESHVQLRQMDFDMGMVRTPREEEKAKWYKNENVSDLHA